MKITAKQALDRPGRASGFTLVELLVVISIIAMLMAFLLPSLQRARQHAQVVVCLTNIRQFHLAASTYSNDFRDYPHSAKQTNRSTGPVTFGSSGEHVGFVFRETRNDNTGEIFKAPGRLLTEGGYTTDKGLQCVAKAPSEGGTYIWSGNINVPWYCYIGPAAMGDGVASYGHSSGLYYFGKMRNYSNQPNGSISGDFSDAPEDFFGASVRNRFTRAMAGCPSVRPSAGGAVSEPHYGYPISTLDIQGDSWFLRTRNYVYNDGHAQFVKLDSHP